MAIGTYGKNHLLDLLFKRTAFAPDLYISLHTATPGLTGTSEVSGGTYTRQLVAGSGWNAASSGANSNVSAIAFTLMPSCTVTHIGIWDGVSGGNFIWGDALTPTGSPLTPTSVVVAAGATFQINSGNLQASLT